jgi:hypothetical protein
VAGEVIREVAGALHLRGSDDARQFPGGIRPDLEPAHGAQICTFFVGQQFVRGVTWHVNPRAHQRYQQQAEAARRTATELKRRLTEAVTRHSCHADDIP